MLTFFFKLKRKFSVQLYICKKFHLHIDANNNLLSTAAIAAVIPPELDERADTVGNKKPRGWTTDQNIALLEEVGNCSAHIPAPRQTKKCWENVTEAL
jgi:hypothetical protein